MIIVDKNQKEINDKYIINKKSKILAEHNKLESAIVKGKHLKRVSSRNGSVTQNDSVSKNSYRIKDDMIFVDSKDNQSNKNFHGIIDKSKENCINRGKLSDENRPSSNVKNSNFNATAPIDFTSSKLKDVIEETDKLMEEVNELSSRKYNDINIKSQNVTDRDTFPNKTSSSWVFPNNQEVSNLKVEFKVDISKLKQGNEFVDEYVRSKYEFKKDANLESLRGSLRKQSGKMFYQNGLKIAESTNAIAELYNSHNNNTTRNSTIEINQSNKPNPLDLNQVLDQIN